MCDMCAAACIAMTQAHKKNTNRNFVIILHIHFNAILNVIRSFSLNLIARVCVSVSVCDS